MVFFWVVYLKKKKEWHSFSTALFLPKQLNHPASPGQIIFHSWMRFNERVHLPNVFLCFVFVFCLQYDPVRLSHWQGITKR